METSGTENFILAGLRCLRFKGIECILGEIKMQAYGDLMAEAKTMTGVIEGEAVSKISITEGV